MAANTTDETVDYNSEGNSQGPTNPKDQRTGYSSVSELLRANYFNTLKKGATSLTPLFEAARAGQLPVQKEQAAQAKKADKSAFSMNDVEAAVAAEMKPRVQSTEKQITIPSKATIFTDKPVKPALIRKDRKTPTLEEFQKQTAEDVAKFRSEMAPVVKIPSQPEKDNSDIEIAIENTMRIFDSQLNKNATNRDFTISNVRNNIYSGLNNGDLRIINDKDGYPIVKNVIDGVLSNIIEGYRQTAIQDREHSEYFSLNKEQQIARLKGYNLKPIETVGETGKLYPEKYRQAPIDQYQGAIGIERTGFAPDIMAGLGQIGYDARYQVARAIPVVGNQLSQILQTVSYAKRQEMDGIASAFNKAKVNDLDDDTAWEIANKSYNKILNALTGAAEGFTSEVVNQNVFNAMLKPVATKSLRTFGQAVSAFVKDAAANSKEIVGSAAIDAAAAWSMEKIRGGSDDAANEQGKMEFLVNMALVGLGAGFKAPKYIKSYAYNAISNINPQDIYTKGVQLEQQGFIPDGTAKSIIENVEKFKKIKQGLVNVREENVASVAGLLMKKESLLESQKTADPSNTQLQASINNELDIVNEKITKAVNAKNPFTIEYDDKTGINLKYNENATTTSEQQENATASNISEHQRTEGIQTQTPYEADNSYSDFGGKKEKIKFPGTVYLDATNASNYSITDVKTPRDFMINVANKVISSLSSINPGLKVVVFDNSMEYGNALVERELGPGTVNNQRASELRGSNGAYDKSNNTIYINGEQLNKNGKTTTLFHEGAHPVINVIASSSPESIDNLYKQLNELSEKTANMHKSGEMPNGLEISDAIDEVVNWADKVYKSHDESTKKSEAIVEFIAKIADGTIALPKDSPIVMKNLLDVIKGFLDIIGMPVDIKSFSDIENIAAKIKEAFETGKRMEVSTVKNKNGEITLYNDNIKTGEPGTTAVSGVINPDFFNTDNVQTDLFQPVGVKWNEFESDGSFDIVSPKDAVRMYDTLKKSGGSIVVTNSDATGIGLSKRGNLRQGGIGFTFIQENLDNEIGFAASDDSKISSFYKAVVDAKNKRDAAYPSESGKPVAIFVMVQSPTAMFGNAYGADYFADALEYVTRNKAISTRKAKAELIDFISNFTKANETGRKYENSFSELVGIIKRYDMSTDEGKNAIDALLITNKESSRDTSNRFGFDARRYFLSNFFAGEGTISSKAPASNLRNALKESGFYIKDFIDEYGDENVVNNLSGKNTTDKYMNDGGFAMTGFFVDPYISEEEFIAKSKNQTFQHRQFNSGFHGVDPFILDGKYYVNEAFPEASFISNKPSSIGKIIPVATSAAGSMYPRTQKNQEQVINRFALQIDNSIKAEKSSGTTQVATTTGSYVKAANIANSLGAKSILDYGAGLGLGSDAMSEIIPNVDSFEPNIDRWKGKKKPTFTSSADINKKYDAVVSLNVLNVVSKDIRDVIVKDIYNKLNNNGSAIISTRGWTGDINQAKNAQKGPEQKSAIIKRKEAGGITDVYQKGFDGNELVDYISDLLGDNVTVKKDNSFGKTGVIITKKTGSLQLQQEGENNRKSAKQTAKENARTEEDALASFAYNLNANKRAQESVEKTSFVKKISNIYKSIRLAGIENQASIRDMFRKEGASGALADALLTTSRGYGAQATLSAEDINETVYGGLSTKKDIDIAGTMVSEVDLLNQIMNQRRVIAVQNMVQEKFDELQSMRSQMKKLRNKAKKEALQVKIDAAVVYLQDRKVLGKKYNPQTGQTTEYLQNYQVGSTVDAAGNKVPYNAGFAKKQLELLENKYNGFSDLSKRADKMFNAYRGLMKEKLDEGLISKETYDYYTKHDYVPISYIDKILQEQDPDYARIIAKNPNQVRKSILGGGGDGDILTDYNAIFEVYVVNHYKNIASNKAAKELTNFIKSVPDNGLVEIANPLVDEDGEVRVDQDGNPVFATAPEGKAYIYFYQDGKKMAIFADKTIADEWYARYSQSDELNIISNLALSSIAQKLFTGKNPGFGIFQMIALDPLTAAVATDVFSKSIPIAYAQIAIGGKDMVGWKGSIEEVIGRGDKYRLAAKWGAFTEMNAGKELETAITKATADEVNGNVYEKVIKGVANFTNKPAEFIDKAMDATGLGKVSDVTEKATRLIIFDRARKVFTDKFVKDNDRQPDAKEMDNIYAMAAAESRRSSDFSRGGSIVKPASRLLIYLNSAVQTRVSVINQARKNPARFAYQVGELLTVGGLLMAYSAGIMPAPWDTEEEKKKRRDAYNSLSEYQKLNYLNIYVGGDIPERMFIKIPIPPVFNNFWTSAVMAFENKYNNANYTAKDFISNMASTNPFGDVTEIPSRVPPIVGAMLAYNNIDIFTKKEIVADEADLPDNYEGQDQESVSLFYKKMGDLTGLSPIRIQTAIKKIVGDPAKNPMVYIPKVALETAIELATGAPISVKEGFEKDWKGSMLKGLSLQSRLFAGTPRFYQTQLEGYLRELSHLQSKAYSSLLTSDQKGFNDYQAQIESKKKEAIAFLEPVKKAYPSLYEKMIIQTQSLMGTKTDLTKSMKESTKRNYIKDNYDNNVYQAYIINNPKIRAMYIYDQVKDMSKEEKTHYFGILYNLGIANEANATGLEYKKLIAPKNK